MLHGILFFYEQGHGRCQNAVTKERRKSKDETRLSNSTVRSIAGKNHRSISLGHKGGTEEIGAVEPGAWGTTQGRVITTQY
jgi:hypothetical protein